jgi:peptide/nickel transport system substrate-binding protein
MDRRSALVGPFRQTRLALALIAVTLLGCTAAPVAPRSDAPRAAEGQPARSKTLTVAVLNAISGYSPWDFNITGGGSNSVAEIHTMGLVSEDSNGNLDPRLAASIPSFADGTLVVHPDGRMDTIWKIRPGVRWHDGTPVTADDFVFTWEILREPEFLTAAAREINRAEAVEAPDAATLVVTWKGPFYRAFGMDFRRYWPFPRHILGEAFKGDRQAFKAHPYFTTEYVSTGPFRLVDFGLGEQQVYERFDGYFLGQPRVNTVIIKTIANANALFASLQAGAVDIAADKTFSGDIAVELRDQWRLTGDGLVLSRQDNMLYGLFQFDPQYARPVELGQEVRLRRGLMHAVDRDAIREAMLPGFPDTSGDTFMTARDARTPTVGQPFARYPYDANRAAEELAAGGWRRAEDGRLVNRDGRRVEIEVRGALDTWSREVALIADYWRRQGIEATETVPARAARDNEYVSVFPGVVVRARGSNEQFLDAFDGRLQATAENRWAGGNNGHYANANLDRLLDELVSMLDVRQQGMALREIGEIMAADLPAMPLYYRTTFAAVRKGTHALRDDYTATGDVGGMARHAHLWDRE